MIAETDHRYHFRAKNSKLNTFCRITIMIELEDTLIDLLDDIVATQNFPYYIVIFLLKQLYNVLDI
jgi:hypothetical protein